MYSEDKFTLTLKGTLFNLYSYDFAEKMKTIFLNFCFLFLLSGKVVKSQEDPICFVQGICDGQKISTLQDIPYKQTCVQV